MQVSEGGGGVNEASLPCDLNKVSRPRDEGLWRVWVLTGDPSLEFN